MSGRTRVTLADGRRVTGFRKTLTRRAPQIPPHLRPDWRVAVLLPMALSLVSPGCTSVPGVTVEPDPISGPLAVSTGKGLEWCCRQLGKFLLAIGDGCDRILTAVACRGDYHRSQQIVMTREGVEFPRGSGKPWRVAA